MTNSDFNLSKALWSGFVALAFAIACCMDSRTVHGANPSLESLVPPVVSRVSGGSILARGSSLGTVEEVLFYEPGIQCEKIEKINEDEIQLHLKVDANCLLGPHPIRLRSSGGISELRTITVSPFPLVLESKDSRAQTVDPNVTVSGTLESDDVDSFELVATAGQRISAEVVAVRLGVNMLDTTLTLRDSQGKVLVRIDDTPILSQDPCFSIKAPKADRYSIEITSAGSNADADSPYALHIGHFPRPLGVFPLGAQAEVQTEIAFFQDSPSEKEAIRQSIRFTTENQNWNSVSLVEDGLECPSRIPFQVSEFVNAIETKLSQETKVNDAPIVLHGQISVEEQAGRHRFRVPHDGLICLEVVASRLGSPLDSIVDVFDNSNQLVAHGDDLESHDTKLLIDASSREIYTVSIRDKRKKFGETYSYAVNILPVKPSLATFLPRRDKLSQSRQTISVPQGNRSLGLIGVKRDQVEGLVTLAIEELPAGLRFESPVVSESTYAVPVVFYSDASARVSGSLVNTIGILKDQGRELSGAFRQVVDLVGGPADAIFQPVTVDRLAIAITEPVPYTLELIQPSIALPVDGTLTLDLILDRKSGFDSPIDVVIPLLPEWVDCEAKTRIPAGESTGQITLRANPKATPEAVWPIVAEASVGLAEKTGGNAIGAADMLPTKASMIGMHSVASSLRSLKIGSSPIYGVIDTISAEVGETVEVDCKLDIQESLPETMSARIEGLPNRVLVEPVEIGKDARSIRFRMTLADDAPTGTFGGIVCRLSGEMSGHQVSYCIARNTKLVIAGQGQSQKDASGRPLSPLEALRRRNSKQ